MKYLQIIVDGTEVDLPDSVGDLLAITYGLSDFVNLGSRKGAGSKTIVFPRTKKNDITFGLTFNSTVVSSVNKSAALSCVVRANGVPVLSGSIKLLEATRETIETVAYEGNSTIKDLLGNKTLQDLNLSDIDHEYSNTVGFNTWAGTYPAGMPEDFFYPFVDYGAFYSLNAGEVAPGRQIDSFYPAVYVRRLIKQIFIDAGITLSTTFFDKVEMGRLLEIFSNKELAHSPAWITDQSYNVTLGAPQIVSGAAYVAVQLNTIQSDPGGNYNTGTYTYTCAEAIRMTICLQADISSFNVGTGQEIVIRKNGVTQSTINITVTGGKTGVEANMDCEAGDLITIEARSVTGDFTIQTATVYNVVSPNVLMGSTVQIANNLRKIKQIDYLKMIMAEFNLMLDIKGSTATLETWDDFFIGEVVNWSAKLSGPPTKVSFTSDDIPNQYRFNYSESDDFYVEQFNKLKPEPDFGNGTFDTGNDFKEADEALDTQHVATKIDKSFNFGDAYLNLPSVIKSDSPSLDADIAPRLLINAGDVSVPTLSDGTYATVMVNSVARTEVPLCYFLKPVYGEALVPNATPDSYDINLAFELPEGDWNGIGLIDKFFKGRLRNYQDLRIVEAEFILNEQDIASLDFRKYVYIEYPGFTGNYIIQEIENYNPLNYETTKVTLLKVQ